MQKSISSVSKLIRMFLTASLVAPAAAMADNQQNIDNYFAKSKEYNSKYFRMLELNATATPNMRYLEGLIPEQRQTLAQAESELADLTLQLQALNAELTQIPLDISHNEGLIQSSQDLIQQTISAAKASGEFSPDEDITPEALNGKANAYQVLVDEKQSQADEKQGEIDSVKADSEYQADLREQANLLTEKSQAESDIDQMSSENSRLTNEIAEQNQAIDTWRQIQRSTSQTIAHINSHVLPGLRSEERNLEQDWDNVNARQRSLIFEINGVEDNLHQIRREEAQLIRSINDLRSQQRQAADRLERINSQLASMPAHRRELNEVNSKIPQVEQRISNLNSQISQLNTRLSKANTRLNQAKSDKRALVNQQKALKAEIRELKQRLASLRAQKAEAEDAKNRLQQIRQQLQTKRSEARGLKGEVDRITSRIQPLVSQRRQINQRISQIEAELGRVGDNKKRRKKLRQEKRRLVSQRQDINSQIQSLKSQKQAKEGQLRQARGVIQRLESQKQNAESKAAQLPAIRSKIQQARQRKQSIEGQLNALPGQIAEAEKRVNSAKRKVAEINNELTPLQNQLDQATRRKRKLQARKSELREILSKKPQLENRKQRIQENMAQRDREIRRNNNILSRVQDRVREDQRTLDRLERELVVIDREKDRVARDLNSVRADIASSESQLNQAIRRRNEAIQGEQEAIDFISSAEQVIADNNQTMASLRDRLSQIASQLPVFAQRIKAFEETNVAPLQAQLDAILTEQQNYAGKRDQFAGWAAQIVDAKNVISSSEQAIVTLQSREQDLLVAKPGLESSVASAEVAASAAAAALAETQQQVTDLTNEVSVIPAQVEALASELDELLDTIRESSEVSEEEPIVLGEVAINESEQFEKDEDGSSKDWESGIITNHKLTGEKACMAFTTVSDEAGSVVARLEVYAPEAQLLNGETVYSEPTIQVVTSSEELMFLDGSVKTERTNKVHMTYSSAATDTSPEQGAVVKLQEKDYMVKRLRSDNSATISLSDEAGEVVEYKFSLRGSSKTIRAAYAACNL